jgi:DHA1 family bicyclomycin/chloramphenicol resistance-like MFS transporter
MTPSARRRFIVMLGLISALGPLSIDLYLPSLPAIGAALDADMGAVQMTVSAYFIGLALGQLVYGPITDRFGRRPPLIFGLMLYSLSSLGCVLASSIEMLVVMRLLQALGGCAGAVVCRALVRDHFSGNEMARVLSALVLVMGVAPILAPTLGGNMQQWFGWHSNFMLMLGFGLAGLAIAVFGVRESGRALAAPLSGRGIARDYRRILSHRRFMGYALAGSCVQAGMFAYITASPFVFIDHFGLAPDTFGMLFGANAAGLILASQLNQRALRHLRAEKLLRAALGAYLVAALVMMVCAISGWGGIWGIALPLLVCLTSLGFTFPNSQAAAMEPFATHAGMASAMLGTLQFLLAGLASVVVARLHSGGVVTMAVAILIWALLAQLALRTLVKPPAPAVG